MKYGLSSETIEKMNQVFSNHINISKVMLYGSRAKGNFREGSDIDLTLFGEDIDIKELHTIELEIDDLLLPYKVDLSIFDRLKNEALREHIQRVGVVFYEKDMREWKLHKLGSLVDIGSSKRIFYNEYVNKGIPFYRSKEIIEKYKGNEVSTELFITQEKFDEIREKFGAPNKNDILLTSVGTLGIPYIVNEADEFYFKDGNLTWFKNYTNDILSLYLYYWIISPIGKNELEMSSIGSTQSALTIKGLKALDILLPPLKEQKAIAEVLSSLDDKIDLLYHQNKTLEELAQTLFRQWFIEEAKDEWEEYIGNTSIQIIDGDRGKNYPKSTEFFSNEYCLFLNAKNVTKNGFDFGVCNFITQKKDEILRSGKLERNDIVLTTRGTVGNLALYDELIKYNNIRINSGMVIFRSPNISPIYLYILMKSQYFTDSVIEQTSGSAQPQLPIRDIKNIKIIIPPQDILEDFLLKASPLYKKINSNQNQIQTLENMRDTLLPKLMSGEMRIKI